MTAAQIRAVKVFAGASLADTSNTIMEILIEIAAQLAEHNEREAEAQAFTRDGNWHRNNC